MKRASHDIPKASKEVILEAAKLSAPAARFLVTGYYDAQEHRKRGDMQIRHLGDSVASELAKTLEWTTEASAVIESQVMRALKAFAEGTPVGRWCLAQHGVGPVLAAGFISYIDIEIAKTAGQIWRFAGLDPTCEWKKGEKRPYNAGLKQLCFHFGECAKRTSGHADAFYGHLYKYRKELLVSRNEAGFNAKRALGWDETLTDGSIKHHPAFVTKSAEVKKTLATGKLPAGNLDRQACNYAAKIFLSHLHAVMYFDHFNQPPPKPFAIQILGHGHEIKVPRADLIPGFEEAYYGAASSKGKAA